MLLSELVQEKRLELGLSLNGLAREIQVSPMFLSKIENNKTVPRTGDTLPKLAAIFKIPLESLKNIANQSVELIKLQNVQHTDENQYRLSLARVMVDTPLTEEQLTEIEKIIKREGK